MQRHQHNLFPFGGGHANAKATGIEMADLVTGRKHLTMDVGKSRESSVSRSLTLS